MKTQHKNIFKAGLQLCAALLGTVLTFFHVALASVLNSTDDKNGEFQTDIQDGFLVSKSDSLTIPLEDLEKDN